MNSAENLSVLVADPHHGVSEGVRGLLATLFRAVVMVADEISLFESAGRLQCDLAVVDLLARWQLAARRLGATVRIEDAGDDLVALLDLVGLRR